MRACALALGRQVTGLRLRFGPQILALEIAQFVMRLEVGGLEPRAALEPDHFHAGLAELGGEDAAGRADADDDDIGFFDRHGFSPLALLACACRPMMGARVNASLLCMSSGVNTGCAPGKPTSRQPAKSLLPP